ncbi:MAG TPA: hypothetical protein VK004_07485 [Ignavibacteria bacterium]|nr:hypothetical protein [Ignavibacteria bacterium]
MRKVIAAINMTLDGICDHTQGIADDEIHLYSSVDGRKRFKIIG